MYGISYWVVPIFSALVWLAMLLAMLLHWVVIGKPHYPSMAANQHIAYISDVGASNYKPLFIAMSTVTVVSLDLVFLFERWLRHTGRLTHNTSTWQKILSGLSMVFAVAGAAGLILLSIFDTLHHPHLHDDFLILFIGGYIVSAIFTCWEYQRLGIHYRQHRILRISFWIKLAFIFIEVALAIVFGVTQIQGHPNVAAIVEWVISAVFTFYVLSFAVDFLPALRTKHHHGGQSEIAQAEQEAGVGVPDHYTGGPAYGYANGTNGGYSNGNAYKPEVPPSRNF